MRVLKQIGRVLAIIIAVLVIVLSVSGIAGSWYMNSVLANVTNQVFSVVNTGAGVAQTGVNRAEQLVTDGRAEVQNASTTVTSVGQHLEENSPVLTALNDRLTQRLGPTVEAIQTTLAPAVDGLRTVNQIVTVANSIPFVRQDSPRLDKLEEATNGLLQLVADAQQFQTTLAQTVVSEKNQVTNEAVGVLTDLATRIDTRLANLEATLQETQQEITAFQSRMDALNGRLLTIYNLATLLLTLLLIWIIYSQVVVIRSQWRGIRTSGADSSAAALPPAEAPAAVASPEPPAAIPVESLPPSEPAEAPAVPSTDIGDVEPAVKGVEDDQ
ncbi:MAG: hypothetical protein KDI07_05420 [Anaerolineae bacterium]|nr:hypothetical protein [Anaerolineae bacterium]